MFTLITFDGWFLELFPNVFISTELVSQSMQARKGTRRRKVVERETEKERERERERERE